MSSKELRLKKSIVGSDLSLESLQAQLKAASVPYTEADCRSCAEPCDEGHESYPSRFDVDMESVMFGSVKPYRRQVVISTGKMDWEREITDIKDSLAAHIEHVVNIASSPREHKGKHSSGVFNSSDSNKLSILNGSHHSISDIPGNETVLIFPEYKVVAEIPRTIDGAKALWDSTLAPNISLVAPKGALHSWIIPYSCVILLCSHKRRDNRCHIASAQLCQAFMHELETLGWSVDTEIEHSLGTPIEELEGSQEDKDNQITKQLQEVALGKKALILRNSHTGGHRYAGNCIIYTPQGAGVWYGRVSTHEVKSIVSQTLGEGLVLPPLLRGGINISRPGCKSLNDW